MKKNTITLLVLLALAATAPMRAQSGTSGDCLWQLSGGTLTIRPAQGAALPARLADWTGQQAPWAEYAAQVKRVSIPAQDGQTAVEAATLAAMFQDMSQAEAFDLSGLRLAYTGQAAMVSGMFSGCTALKMLTLPAATAIDWASTGLAIPNDADNRLRVVASGTPWDPQGATLSAGNLAEWLTQQATENPAGYTVVRTRLLTNPTYTLVPTITDTDGEQVGVGTLCWPVSVSVQNNDGLALEAYTVTGTEPDTGEGSHPSHADEVLQLHCVTDGDDHRIPAHTPVIVVEGNRKSIELPAKETANTTTAQTACYYSTAPVPVTTAGNLLTGCYTPIAIDGDNDYVLQQKTAEGSHGVAFYWVNPDHDTFTTTAHRCFLRLPEGTSAQQLDLQVPGKTTGIHAPAAPAPARQGIYTLAGERVSHMEKGRVYILNGRKVIVR